MGNAGAERRKNRLAGETSPYLLQHAENPVDWFPWGPEALARAKELDRPILLSIGYAACHWCHVMERESFEDEGIAALMNAHYVCVKVDREERPDLDDIYMAATVAMSGGGGWPMTVFLTPNQQPFFAGTYFPPTAKYGKPSFTMLLERLHEAWMKERETVVAQAGQLTEIVAQQAQAIPPAAIGPEVGESAVVALAKAFDKKEGGFGGAPKFPPHQSLALLLRHHHSLGKETSLSLDMVRLTLDRMKDGGMYDHVGGGFCRYATDAIWLVPHFEKMLYDNAQLARVYTDAYVVTGDLEYARIAKETLDYVVREMQGTHGGYFSATDADSEGIEGKFFVFSLAEIEDLLGDDAALFAQAFDVTEHGNWEEQNIVHLARPLSELAREQETTPEALRITLRKNLDTLYAAREKRVHPLLDDKVLAAWNGLMIGAMAEGARVFADPKYLESATRAREAVVGRLMRPDGGLYRTFRSAGSLDKAHLDAYLEDYAFLGDGLVDLYEASGDAAHLHLAKSLCDRMIADFRADDGGGFLFTAKDHEALLVRPREGADNATPSPNGVAARLCARLGAHLGDDALRARAEDAIAAYGRIAFRQPRPFSTSIMVAEMLASPPTEVVLVGDPTDSAFIALDRALAGAFLPNRALARITSLPAASLPLLEGRGDSLVPARAYVCEKFVCLAPITDPAELARALAKPR